MTVRIISEARSYANFPLIEIEDGKEGGRGEKPELTVRIISEARSYNKGNR